MIRIYQTGSDLVAENRALLETDKLLSVFFFLDGAGITKADTHNYALRVGEGSDTLLAMKQQPWDLLLFGSPDGVPELVDFLTAGGYDVGGLLGSLPVCERFAAVSAARYGQVYERALLMDFMESRTVTEPSDGAVEVPTEDDVEEIAALSACFITDCGLADAVDVDAIRRNIGAYRVIRAGGRIVSMARIAPSADYDRRISNVYTRPEARGQGYARRVVNTVKNEILAEGRAATLNVDRFNPVTNHLYESLGFVRLSPQAEYRPKAVTRPGNIRLVKLTPEYRPQLEDMMSEWLSAEQSFSPYVIRKNDYRDFDKYLSELETKEAKNGRVPDSVFFCLDTERNIFVGAVNIRHYLNESLLFTGGHIGDGIRPSERRKGYATAMIGLALDECRRLGLDRVLMTCDADNVGSAKSIRYNGGILENTVINEEGVPEERYWIEL